MHGLFSMETKYTHLFFDLDRTLWDFDTNSRETLAGLYEETGLANRGIPHFESFLDTYHTVNTHLWEQYRTGVLSQESLRPMRFDLSFQYFGLHDPALAAWFGEEYLRRSALRKDLFPGAIDTLEYLRSRYRMHIISNGFADVQFAKLKHSGLDAYFDTVTTSEEAGFHKPDPGIFKFALGKAGAASRASLMIGDDMKMDIEGAALAGMDQVWYNPGGHEHPFRPTYAISSLAELKHLL